MRLVHSSEAGAVERDQAARLLTDRATLTRMVCRELAESDINGLDRRPQAALYLLLRWIVEQQSEHVRGEPRADDGLEQMIVPEGYEEIVSELKAGAQVCNALFMLFTADTALQATHDRERIQRHLVAYWERHSKPVSMPRQV